MKPQEIDLARPVRQYIRPTQTTLRQDLTVAQAIAALRDRQLREQVLYFYVVDDHDKLVGVAPVRRLLLSDPGTPLSEAMHRPVVSVHADETLSQAMARFAKQRFLALPVVENDGTLLGLIDVRLYADEAVDMAVAEREADVFALIGVWIDQYERGSPWQAYRLRMPWLVCNLIGGFLCAGIATAFGHVVETVLVIAAFIPLVLTLCESISIQSLTLGLQHMHASKIEWGPTRRIVGREWRSALLMGVTCAIIVGLASLLWQPAAATVAAIGLAIVAAMALAATIGLLVPLGLHLLKLDPKVAAGPLVLMTVDSTSLLIYLGLAHLAAV